jgi:hypothetical protein
MVFGKMAEDINRKTLRYRDIMFLVGPRKTTLKSPWGLVAEVIRTKDLPKLPNCLVILTGKDSKLVDKILIFISFQKKRDF